MGTLKTLGGKACQKQYQTILGTLGTLLELLGDLSLGLLGALLGNLYLLNLCLGTLGVMGFGAAPAGLGDFVGAFIWKPETTGTFTLFGYTFTWEPSLGDLYLATFA